MVCNNAKWTEWFLCWTTEKQRILFNQNNFNDADVNLRYQRNSQSMKIGTYPDKSSENMPESNLFYTVLWKSY